MMRSRPIGPSAVLVVGMLGMPTLAWADVILPPPEECPVGSLPEECHGPELCRPRLCQPDECPLGQTCSTAELCVKTINCGGMGDDPRTHVVGPCEADGTCSDFAECQPVMVCVAEGSDSTATQGASSASSASGAANNDDGNGSTVDRGCACTTDAPASLLGLLPWVFVGLRLRRRS